MTIKLFHDHFDTPIGKMEITANNHAVVSIHFVERAQAVDNNAITDQAKAQMLQYFAGKLEQFDMPMEPTGTEFQKKVWRALTSVEYGTTCSYAEIAGKINKPKAVRAVGSANGRNPMTIVVPCHRIIGSNGSLTGYASGVERKAWLLNHESTTLF